MRRTVRVAIAIIPLAAWTVALVPEAAGAPRCFGRAGRPASRRAGGADVLTDVEAAIGSFDDDTLSGGPGDDALAGWDGDDSLSGEAGADLLLGEEGTDGADGGPGIDTCDAEVELDCELDSAAEASGFGGTIGAAWPRRAGPVG